MKRVKNNSNLIVKWGFIIFTILSFYPLLKQPVIRIYHDEATVPSLTQMVHILKENPKDAKFIAWKRFAHPNQDVLSQINAQASDFDSTLTIEEQAETFIKKHPFSRIQVYYNISHPTMRAMVESHKLWRKRVSYNIYDDSPALIWINKDNDYVFDRIIYRPNGAKNYSLAPRATFYFYKMDILKSPHCDNVKRCKELKTMLNHKKVVSLDVKTIAQELSPQEKEKLYLLLGVDREKLQQTLSHRPFGVYVLGTNWLSMDLQQFALLEKLCQTTTDVQWFYKAHPNLFMPQHLLDGLKQTCPNLQELDARMPFEVLFFLDLTPDIVAGFSSSLFFELDKKDIAFYLPRHEGEIYLNFLKELNILDDSQVIKINTEELPLAFQKKPHLMIHDFFWRENVFEVGPDKWCRIFEKEYPRCAQVTKKEKDTMILTWEDGVIRLYKKVNDYTYKAIDQLNDNPENASYPVPKVRRLRNKNPKIVPFQERF